VTNHYVRFAVNGQTHFGLLSGDQIAVIHGDIFGEHQLTGQTYPLSEVQLLTPCQPSKVVCVGLNYRKHALELGMKLPGEPVIFLKPTTALLPPGGDIVYWPTVGQLDYEGEFAIVIGQQCHQVAEADAMQYIFGYTVANDVTARDLQSKDIQWSRAKSFDTFCPLGPSIVTGVDASDLALRTFLNGKLKQDGRTSDVIFSIPYMVSFVSQVMTLYPGDVILTGTPSGIGPMQVGDEVTIEIEGLGALTNRVAQP